jgi:hypothetical protein
MLKSVVWSYKAERENLAGLYVRCGNRLWKFEFSTGLSVRFEGSLSGLCVPCIGTLRAVSYLSCITYEDPVVASAILWICGNSETAPPMVEKLLRAGNATRP